GPQRSVCQRDDRFSLQPFENRRWKLLDLLLRSDRRRSSAHPLQVVIGEFSGNIGKKTLAAREIENHTFQLIGVFIDEPGTGEVIRKVFANRRRGGTEQLIDVQLGYNLIVDFEEQLKTIALLCQLPLVPLSG